MHRMRNGCLVAGFLVWVTIGSRPSDAQYTANSQFNIISGALSNWSGSYIVGSNTFADILFVQNSGMLANGNGYLGYEAGANNNLAAIIGSGSVWSNAGNLYIGDSGADNFLWISAGGQVVDSTSYLGYTVTSTNNRVQVSGPGSTWNGGDLHVGELGSGNSLIISEGGLVVNNSGYVGYSNNLNGVLVTGSGSVWTNGNLLIGYYGSGNSLTISNGGKVFCGFGTIGTQFGSNNTVLVTGAGSVWSSSNPLFIGYSGNNGGGSYGGNKLVVSDGGQVSAVASYMVNGSNSVVVSGAGSVWSNSGPIDIGMNGANNSLVVSNGGHVVSSGGSVTFGSGYGNTALVTDPGSVWSNNGDMALRGTNANSLVIRNGGLVVDNNGTVGTGEFSRGCSVVVTGLGSVWINHNGLRVQGQRVGNVAASNSVVISDGGQVYSSGSSSVGGSGIGNASVLVTGIGSAWYTDGSVIVIGLDGLVISNGGQVVAGSVSIGTGQITVSGGTLCVTNAAGNGLLEIGMFQASLALHNGVVTANKIQVDALSYLSGCGTVNGDVFVQKGTVLANCGGTLTFTGIVTNNAFMRATGGSVLEFYGPVVNNGIIDVMDGAANFHSTFINNGSLVDSSYFRVVSIAVQSNDINITWTTAGGHSNIVQVATGSDGSYSNNFIDLSPVIFIVPNADLSTTSYLDIGGATNSPARFYRVRFAE